MAVVVSELSGAESAYWESFTASVINPACAAGNGTTKKFPPVIVKRALIRPSDRATFRESTRVLVRPIGLDMVEVGGSTKCDHRSICHRAPMARSPQGRNRLKPVSGNPPGPTKIKNPPLGGFFGFGGVGSDESRYSTNATNGAFGPPQQSEGARRVQSPEAMAIEDNPPGSTKYINLCFLNSLFS